MSILTRRGSARRIFALGLYGLVEETRNANYWVSSALLIRRHTSSLAAAGAEPTVWRMSATRITLGLWIH